MSFVNRKIQSSNQTRLLMSITLIIVGCFILIPLGNQSLHAATSYDSLFTVTVETKTSDHPYFGMGNSQGFVIDGVQGAELTLQRGMTYAFKMDNVPGIHPFYISESDQGAGTQIYSDGVVGNGATGNDTLFLTPNINTPDLLYYQCENHEYMGYKINVAGSVISHGTFIARLSGSSEVPPLATTGSGMVTATLDGDSLFLSGSFQNLSSNFNSQIQGGAHIHMAYAGQNAGIIIPINATLNSDNRSGTFDESNNRFALTTSQKMALAARRLYVNIHTINNPAGELRGQLLPESDATFEAIVTGGSKVNAVNTMAYGTVVGEMQNDSLFITGSFAGLTEGYTASHLHLGIAGTAGSVEIPLAATTGTDANSGFYAASENSFALTSDQVNMLMNRQLYVNIHSNGFPAGEIRGQLVPRSDAYFEATLSGAAEVPLVRSNGRGNTFLELRGDSLFVTGSFSDLTSTYQASHLHLAIAGQNGAVEIPLTVTTDSDVSGHYAFADNKYEITSDEKTALFNRQFYVNVHSSMNPAGELRGQVAPISNLYFQTSLSGRNEVQPDSSAGMGGVLVELSGTNITLSGTFSDLSSDFASNIAGGSHLHIAGADANGGIAIPLTVQLESDNRAGMWMADENMYQVSADTAIMLMNGQFYTNVHSDMYNAGELRGQVLLSPNFPPDSTSITNYANGDTVTVEGSSAAELNMTWDAANDQNSNQVVYIFQLSAASDFSADALVVNTNVGTATEYTADFGTLATLLDDIGLEIGGSMDMYARVISSDGSDQTEGPTREIVMKRGQITAVENQNSRLPKEFTLLDNYPNPFNPTTTIPYNLPKRSDVTLTIYDMLGRKVATLVNKTQSAGHYTVQWNGLNDRGLPVSTGIYFYKIRADQFTNVKKMVFMK